MPGRAPPLPKPFPRVAAALAAAAWLWPARAFAAFPPAAAADGPALGLVWLVPFAGLLLSIALVPLAAPGFWHRHYGKIAAGWAFAFLLPYAWRYGAGPALAALARTLLHDYLPFVLLLLALFIIAGGIRLNGRLPGTPLANTAFLAIGTLLASVAGTAGASVLLIRPLVVANLPRRHKVHVFVFFIFLVSNIGGALTPLGDPPLFLGFLAGVDFFWPTRHLLAPMLFASGSLLAVFLAIDWLLARRDDPPAERGALAALRAASLRIEGRFNLLLMAGVIGAVLLSGLWRSPLHVVLLGTELALPGLVRDLLLLALSGLSLWATPRFIREANGFSWFPVVEVAKLFAGIFVTIVPAIAILQAGRAGAAAPLVALAAGPGGAPSEARFFWLTGILSSVLDNAPTYLMSFNLAGGDPARLMGPLAGTLAAISTGAVFMGANTYIGNAPNFMVRSLCEALGVRMPSFLGYMAWSLAVLGPLYLALTVLFF
jgi:Na+/H+ antiporter NhaD/arsenite permease-like protein